MPDMMLDLFGKMVPVPTSADPAMTPKQRRKLNRRPTEPRGYAMPPGTGPEGETCGTCEHIMRTAKYRKCELNRARWTHGPGTDIKARTAACSKWEKERDEKPTQ